MYVSFIYDSLSNEYELKIAYNVYTVSVHQNDVFNYSINHI